MAHVKRVLAVSATFLCLATPAAGEGGAVSDASEALQGLATLLEGIIDAVPHYELPEVLENGDVIIRRVPDEPERLPEVETESAKDI